MNEATLDDLLREGLRCQPVPVASPNFDNAVIASLQAASPWYVTGWNTVRPAVASAVGAMFATLGLIYLTNSLPIIDRPGAARASTLAQFDSGIVDRALNRPVVTVASLGQCLLANRVAVVPTPARPPISTSPRPTGRASRPQYLA